MWIQINTKSGFGFTGKSNGLDSLVLSEVTSLLFVCVCDTGVTSGFASESTSKLTLILAKRPRSDSLDSQIRIRIRQIEYVLSAVCRDGHETSMAETETRRLQVSRRDRDVEVHVEVHIVINTV